MSEEAGQTPGDSPGALEPAAEARLAALEQRVELLTKINLQHALTTVRLATALLSLHSRSRALFGQEGYPGTSLVVDLNEPITDLIEIVRKLNDGEQ